MDIEVFKAGKKNQLEAIKILEVGYFDLLNDDLEGAQNKFYEFLEIQPKLVAKNEEDRTNSYQLEKIFKSNNEDLPIDKIKFHYFDLLKTYRGKLLRFSCDQNFKNMEITPETKSRLCDVCSKHVHPVNGLDELYDHFYMGNCVTLVNEELERKDSDLNIPKNFTYRLTGFSTIGKLADD